MLSQVWSDFAPDGFSVSYGGRGDDIMQTYAETLGNVSAQGFGGKGNDRVVVKAWASGAASVLADGGAGNDRLETLAEGTDASIVARGGAGRDTIIVETVGETSMSGGRGNDRSILSDGADTFHFGQIVHQGADTVERWDSAEDVLVLNGWNGTAAVTDDGTDVLVGFTNGSSITFTGAGDSTMDSIYDLVNDPGQITGDWIA